MSKKASSTEAGSTRSTSVSNGTVITNKKGVVVGGGSPAPDGTANSKLSREEVANQRAAVFEQKKKENQNRGLTKESAIELQLKAKRLADAEALQKQNGDNYNMKWGRQ